MERDYSFKDIEEAREFFTRITGLYKNFNYSPSDSPNYERYRREIEALADKHSPVVKTAVDS